MYGSKTKDWLVPGAETTGVLELWEDMTERDVRPEMVDALLGHETGSFSLEEGMLPESAERLETLLTRCETRCKRRSGDLGQVT
ncbi:hypothetical protein GOP47_0021945 [Adiantum capillus-veneris]|uniref:Uncharacterized protein n=1 Tax=Adiantum capillus-veneris TaxID=13818 RepID=A0A9D4Z5P7_ADICA|nr:hypothetical protein GOP47_0021945 [Adiantum capillus-veneris]